MAGYRTPFAREEVKKSAGKERNGCSKECFVNKDISNELQSSSTLPLAGEAGYLNFTLGFGSRDTEMRV